MLDELGLFFGVLFLLVGGVLLYVGLSNSDASQSTTVISGATFLSLGSFVMALLLKSWWEWRKEYRRYRSE
jgi:drug/metabolite transporter (DMT)-like permease